MAESTIIEAEGPDQSSGIGTLITKTEYEPTASPSTYLTELEVKSKKSTVSSTVNNRPNEKVDNVPGSGFYDVGGKIVWRDAKKKISPRTEKEMRSPASLGALRSQAGRLSKNDRGSKLSLDFHSSPPSRLTNSIDLQGHMYPGYNTPSSDFRSESRFWGRGLERSFGPGRRLWFQDSPGPGEYELKGSPRGPAHSMGMKLPPPHIVQQMVKKDGPSPNAYDLNTSLGKGTAKSFLGRRRDPFKPGDNKENPAPNYYALESSFGRDSKISFTGNRHNSTFQGSRGQLHVNQELGYGGTPAPGYYDVKTTGMSPGVSFKGDRSKYFQGAEKAVFLMPRMCNDTPAPNYYSIDSNVGKSEGVSFKGRRIGPFQSNRGVMHIKPELNDPNPPPGKYNIETTMGRDTPAVSFKGRRSESLFGEPVRRGVDIMGSPRQQRARYADPKSSGLLVTEETPGPGQYNTSKNIAKNSSPSYTMAKRANFPGFMTTPGPGSYDISNDIAKNNSPRSTFGRADDYPVTLSRSRIAQSHSMLSLASDTQKKEWISLTSRSEPPMKKSPRHERTLPVPRSTPATIKPGSMEVTIVQN